MASVTHISTTDCTQSVTTRLGDRMAGHSTSGKPCDCHLQAAARRGGPWQGAGSRSAAGAGAVAAPPPGGLLQELHDAQAPQVRAPRVPCVRCYVAAQLTQSSACMMLLQFKWRVAMPACCTQCTEQRPRWRHGQARAISGTPR